MRGRTTVCGAAALCLAALVSAALCAPERGGARDDDARLAGRVTLTCASEPLPSVLAKAGAPQGVRLAASPELRQATTTVAVKDVPLRTLMDWLGAAYGADWRQEDGGYVLARQAATKFDQQLARLGDPGWFSYGLGPACYQEQRQVAWEIRRGLTPQQAAAAGEEGVAFVDLPEESRKRLVWVAQSAIAIDRLGTMRKAMPDVLSRSVLRVRRAPAGAKGQESACLFLDGAPLVELPWPR